MTQKSISIQVNTISQNLNLNKRIQMSFGDLPMNWIYKIISHQRRIVMKNKKCIFKIIKLAFRFQNPNRL